MGTMMIQRPHGVRSTDDPSNLPDSSSVPTLSRVATGIECPTQDGINIPAIVLNSLRSPGQPLDEPTRTFVEARFGQDFSHVRVHTDSQAAASAEVVNAKAYTVGHHVVFGRSQFAPASPQGHWLLAHELTHVIQQGHAGPSSSNVVILPPETSAEREADQSASHVLGFAGRPSLHSASAGLQRQLRGAETDPIHRPLIEDYRRRHGLPQGGRDEFGNSVGPSDAEIKYQLGRAEIVPICPEVEVIQPQNLRDPAVRRAFMDVNCISSESQTMHPACRFTPRQERFLRMAQRTAAARVQKGLDRIGTGAPGRQFATELTRQLFSRDPPSVGEVLTRLRSVRNFLAGSAVQFSGRTCGDETCQRPSVLAYVNGAGELPIFICPTAFSQAEGLHRTVLHEALHWSGLDADPATVEGYCQSFDCRTPCLTRQDADAWTHYLDCLGKPIEFRRDFRKEILESVHEIP